MARRRSSPVGCARSCRGWRCRAEMKTYRIIAIPGDGIGPELIDATLEVLETLQAVGGFQLAVERVSAGAAHYRETGRNMSDQDLERCRQADAVLKAPVGLPEVTQPDGTEAGLLGGTLRLGLDLYANLRPVKLWPGVK